MKRFTETDKWKDAWFRGLSAGAKLAFIYIVENCDNAGVWSPDKELADFAIGMKIPWEKVLKDFGERVKVLPSGDWFVTKFVEFQFGTLSDKCKPHQKIIALIERHRVSKGYPKGIHTLEDKTGQEEEEERKKTPRKIVILPTLDQARDYAPSAGVNPDVAEIWWNECSARPLASSGAFQDRDGNEIASWKHHLTSYGRKWHNNESRNNRNGKPSEKPVEPMRSMFDQG